MSLLMNIVVYLIVGCAEWYLALRRTLACARGEKVLLVCIVFIENLLGLWVLSNFVRRNDWSLALSYSGGASAGALLVASKTQTRVPPASHSPGEANLPRKDHHVAQWWPHAQLIARRRPAPARRRPSVPT